MQPVAILRRIPWSVVGLGVALIGLGWLGIARCDELAEQSGRYLRQQAVWSLLALAAMFAMCVPNYRALGRWAYGLFAAAVVLLIAVYFFPRINGAHRWIRFGPIGLQPSEFAKVATVLALARYLMYRDNYRRLRGLLLPLTLATVPVLLVLKEPDLGMAMVFLPVLFVMLFAAGARRGDLAWLVAVGVLMTPLLWSQMSKEQKSRVTSVLDQAAPPQKPSDDGFQLYQAKRMLALGGGWGSLWGGQPTEELAAYRLPEARTDFIFCVLGERLGLPGLAAILAMFGLLVWRGLAIAAATREPFGRLAAIGLTAMIAVQMLINTAMNVGLLPITGLSLPLVSYGGSGLLATGVMLGLLLNIGLRPGYEVTNEPFRHAAE